MMRDNNVDDGYFTDNTDSSGRAVDTEAEINYAVPEAIQTLFMSDTHQEVLWDTGATASVSFDINDFD